MNNFYTKIIKNKLKMNFFFENSYFKVDIKVTGESIKFLLFNNWTHFSNKLTLSASFRFDSSLNLLAELDKIISFLIFESFCKQAPITSMVLVGSIQTFWFLFKNLFKYKFKELIGSELTAGLTYNQLMQ